MKLNNLIYGVLTIFAFSSCADQMEYSEYNPYDAGYVKRTFYDVGGLVSNIYQSLDSDFGNYSGAILGSATDESQYSYTGNAIETFYNGAWSPVMHKAVCGLPVIKQLLIVTIIWRNLPD